MESSRIDAFFSCSFKEEDRNVNDFFTAICRSLDIKCINVEGAYNTLPPDVAKKKIDQAQGLIGIATKRIALADGTFSMPPAVNEEISMAYAKETPILLFVEEGIAMDGMKGNFGTYQNFSRDKLLTNENIEKTIKSIHGFKLEIISPNDIEHTPESSEMIADYLKLLIELKNNSGDYFWAYSNSKKITFQNTFKRQIPAVFWATVPARIGDNPKPIHAEFFLENHSKNLQLNIETQKETADLSKSFIKIEPNPEKGDFIEYSSYVESKYFNPIYRDDIKEENPIEYKNKKYLCIDGFIPLHPTKMATLEFRLPRGFNMNMNEITFIVGSYTDEIDYIVESEIKRASVEYTEIGGNITARMEIESPLPRHMYAFAWNPPIRNC